MAIKSLPLILASLLGVGAVTGGLIAWVEKTPQPPANEVSRSTQPNFNDRRLVNPAVPNAPIKPSSTAQVPPPEVAQPDRQQPPDDRPNSTQALRTIEKCRVVMAIVNDKNPPLNVRSQPSLETGKIVGSLPDGSYVSVKQEDKGWLEIVQPAGWIAKSKTVSRCGDKLEKVQFAPGSTGTTISDEFLGTGSHQYQLQLAQGQTVTVNSTIGPTPALISPNGQYLIGMDEQSGNWSRQLTQTGLYTLEMDSNFRGYKYDFTIVANPAIINPIPSPKP